MSVSFSALEQVARANHVSYCSRISECESQRVVSSLVDQIPEHDGDDEGDDGDQVEEVDRVRGAGCTQAVVVQPHCQDDSTRDSLPPEGYDKV